MEGGARLRPNELIRCTEFAPFFFPSFPAETNRRMERQDTRSSPASAAAISNASRLEYRAGTSAAADKPGLGGGPPVANADRDEASRVALGALLQDGAEADALRKMRALLEEDQRKRRRSGGGGSGGGEGRGGGDGGGGGSSSSRKKKSRKKDKKSSASSKSKRSSSSRHKKKRERRESGGGEAGYDSGSSSSSSGSGGSDAGDNSSADARSSSSKKKKKKKKEKKQHHKHKKRSSAGSRNAVEGRGGLGGTVSASLSAGGGADSGDEAHPILQRKKHSLWG